MSQRFLLFISLVAFVIIPVNTTRSLANITPPPPPSISYNNGYGRISEYSYQERISLCGGIYNVTGTVEVGGGGIILNCKAVTSIRNGSLTAYGRYLDVELNVPVNAKADLIYISSPIHDRGWYSIGLRVRGNGFVARGNYWNSVILEGGDNTFTGDTLVEGKGIILALNKINNATAIQGDISLRDGGGLSFWNSNQVADLSTVTMGDGTHINLGGAAQEKIHRLVVKGDSTIGFWSTGNSPYTHFFYLDELDVDYWATLKIAAWIEGRDFLLVRKNSKTLQDALSRIKFEGRWEWKAGVKHYNHEYWQIIPASPEPSTYGAIVSAVGLGLVAWKRRRGALKYPESHCSG